MKRMILGTELTPADQREAKRRYVYRFTRTNRPQWINQAVILDREKTPPLQFDSDSDWLANTYFPVTKYLRLAANGSCESHPTWPDNPELHAEYGCGIRKSPVKGPVTFPFAPG